MRVLGRVFSRENVLGNSLDDDMAFLLPLNEKQLYGNGEVGRATSTFYRWNWILEILGRGMELLEWEFHSNDRLQRKMKLQKSLEMIFPVSFTFSLQHEMSCPDLPDSRQYYESSDGLWKLLCGQIHVDFRCCETVLTRLKRGEQALFHNLLWKLQVTTLCRCRDQRSFRSHSELSLVQKLVEDFVFSI